MLLHIIFSKANILQTLTKHFVTASAAAPPPPYAPYPPPSYTLPSSHGYVVAQAPPPPAVVAPPPPAGGLECYCCYNIRPTSELVAPRGCGHLICRKCLYTWWRDWVILSGQLPKTSEENCFGTCPVCRDPIKDYTNLR